MIHALWNKHRTSILRLAIVLLAAAALFRLTHEYWRLLFDPGVRGAHDLRTFHNGVQSWFAGRDVFSEAEGDSESAGYPPATYPILWPLLGWAGFEQARWIWAITSAVMLLWLSYLTVRESGTDGLVERMFVALIPLSMNATGVAIGNGQLTLHLIPVLMAGLILLRKDRALAAFPLLLAMAKPSIALPFLWIVLFAGNQLRTKILIVTAYAATTAFAMSFQNANLSTVIQRWIERGSVVAAGGGYGNVNSWLSAAGLQSWTLLSSLLIFFALGYWIYAHRAANFWLLCSISAIVARMWTYHRMYDDLLILLPMIALFQICKKGNFAAGILLALLILLNLARLGNVSELRYVMVISVNQILWIVSLIFLLGQTTFTARAGRRDAGATDR